MTTLKYMRGLVDGRLANQDNWTFIFVSGKSVFPGYMLEHLSLILPEDALTIGSHEIRAADKFRPLWISMAFIPKGLFSDCREEARSMGIECGDDQDIFLMIEPDAPKWAGTGAMNYLDCLRTGEGIWQAGNPR